jgi:nitronate monooxygenase
MTIDTALTERLSISHPILLAPMDVIADARLTAAVSAAGGLGILGAGYGDESWLERQLDLLDDSRSRFAVGFITWSMAKQPKLLDLALERNPAAVMLSFGELRPFAEKIKRGGAALICQVQSVALAKDAAAAGADILVAQGTEAGGHGMTRGTMSLVPEVVDATKNRIPVVAAGGIADGRGLAAALMLGASGVLLGTRFYASTESPAAEAAKERVRNATGDDTVRSLVFDITRRNVWPGGFTGRCLRNAHLDRWLGHEDELTRNQEEEAAKYLEARGKGNFDIAAVIAGESSGLVHDIRPAKEIVDRIVAEASELLGAKFATGKRSASNIPAE